MEEIDIDEEDLDLTDDYEGYDEYEQYLKETYNDTESPPEIEQDTVNMDTIERQREYIRDRSILESMEDEINEKAKSMYPREKTYRSILLRYFPPDVCVELEKIRRNFSVTPQAKEEVLKDVLHKFKVPFRAMGIGTNRCAVMVDGFIVKIALDTDGMIDNKREFLYSLALQPYVIKVYECNPTGLLSVCEYVYSLTKQKFDETEATPIMRKILKEISAQFFIGDVGITTANYGNWGIRIDTKEYVILDFAYVYSVAYKIFQCSCSGEGMLYYDRDFVELICPLCGKHYTFGQIRKRISRNDQNEEIGDITTKGYVLDKPIQKKKFNHRFVIDATDNIREELEKDKKKEQKRLEREMKEEKSIEFHSVREVLDYYCN